MNANHRSAIERRAVPPQPGRAPQIDTAETGRIEMGRWRTLLTVGLAVTLAVLLAGCGLGETASGDVRSGPAGPDAVRVVMGDNLFEPDVLEVPPGAPVTVEVRNAGQDNHNFTIDDLDLSTGPMESGDVMTVRFTAPSGSTAFRCTWHEDMVGRVVAS